MTIEQSTLDKEYFAWKFYCEDTSGSADVRDYLEDLSQRVKDFYIARPIRSVVVCAANKFSDGLIVCGARHYDRIMHRQIKIGLMKNLFKDSLTNLVTSRQEKKPGLLLNTKIRSLDV